MGLCMTNHTNHRLARCSDIRNPRQSPVAWTSRRGWALLFGLVLVFLGLPGRALSAQSRSEVQVAARVQQTPARPVLDLALASAAAAPTSLGAGLVRETLLARVETRVLADPQVADQRRMVVSVEYVRN
jgi:hypothetical protein